jgi:putative CocE/NonD family hydrolase
VTAIRSAEVAVEADIAAAMRDGTILRADVYRPARGKPCPALVCRTPYGKRGEAFGADYRGVAEGLARRGYIAVVQDVRGRYASGGEYHWLYGPEAAAIHAADGFDTTEWAAALDGCDGRVGTFGNSYDGYTALRTAGAAPPSLAAALASGVASRTRAGGSSSQSTCRG